MGVRGSFFSHLLKGGLFLFLGIQSVGASPAKRILFLGDSLTEGYGISREAAYPALLEKKLNHPSVRVEVLNGSVSGSTSASAVSRLRWYLRSKPDLLFLALGANDGLRGVSPASLEKNLEETIQLAQKNRISVVLAGMKLPPNYGAVQKNAFDSIYPRLAKKYKLSLVPFLLQGVAGEKDLNQEDSIHPNELGHERIAALVLPYLEKAIESSRSR